LSAVLLARHDHTGDERDLAEAAEVLRQATATAPVATPREQIDVHARWGRLAARTGDWRAALDALATAVALLPQVVPVELHRDDQEHQLAGFTGLASDAAACALQVGDPRCAVELLEQGRGVLLTQAVARGEEFELRERNATLADRLNWLRAEFARGADVTAEWEQLMKGIRTMPGFERFLLPSAIDELLPDLPNGPVVLINVSQFRSDALILDAGEVRVVPLPALNPSGVRDHTTLFLAAIEVVYPHPHPNIERQRRAEQDIRGTLCWLWEAVAAPVLNTLTLTAPAHRDTLPRLWWSPTGLLSLLPLHAAGHHHDQPHDPSGLLPRAVIDRVISSYTPTVQMLRWARRRQQELPVGRPRVLMVSMPNTPGARQLSHTWREVFASAGQSNIRILSDQGATRQQVIAELPAYTWVHFACHSYTDLVRPSASYLILHDHADQRLTAQDISSLRLRGVQLAFLSACDTARTNGNLADEAIHLASSFQIAGYPHVVATLWPVRDQDANLVAEVFYEKLADRTGADRDCFATAVHEAISELRSNVSRNEPWEWSGYIHMGP
jgi:hypothetical protein